MNSLGSLGTGLWAQVTGSKAQVRATELPWASQQSFPLPGREMRPWVDTWPLLTRHLQVWDLGNNPPLLLSPKACHRVWNLSKEYFSPLDLNRAHLVLVLSVRDTISRPWKYHFLCRNGDAGWQPAHKRQVHTETPQPWACLWWA